MTPEDVDRKFEDYMVREFPGFAGRGLFGADDRQYYEAVDGALRPTETEHQSPEHAEQYRKAIEQATGYSLNDAADDAEEAWFNDFMHGDDEK